VIISYTEDYASFMLGRYSFFEILFPSDMTALMEYALDYVPVSFTWWLFWTGQGMILMGIGAFYRRNR
jgi:hypothetical protein